MNVIVIKAVKVRTVLSTLGKWPAHLPNRLRNRIITFDQKIDGLRQRRCRDGAYPIER